MFKAYVLIRNVESRAKHLSFGEFTIELIGPRFNELREVFSSADVNQDDWIFEKSYAVPPPGPPGSPVGGIPHEIEDILLVFRLYKAGDIAFIKQAIVQPSGSRVVQFPYRAMNDLNSYSALRFELQTDECESWKAFAKGIMESRSWNSEWFSVARRFFLYGGAKEFNPRWDDVDRILDYVTALQAALVPEMDFVRRRINRRSALLISSEAEEQSAVAALVKQLYDIRSSIAHGSKLSDEKRNWLIDNCGQVELWVRQVLVAAVQNVPAEEAERRTMLAGLYDPADEERGEFALQKFQEIRTDPVRKTIREKIGRLLNG
jgi:Apea-like HEPN